MLTVCDVLIQLLAGSYHLHYVQPPPFTALYCTRAYKAGIEMETELPVPKAKLAVRNWLAEGRMQF